jgi:diguanylate cyclase (GGDEF)-like protein
MLKREIVSADWTSFEGVRDYVRRRFLPDSKWSLVLVKPTEEIFASRVLGIAITLFGTVMTLIYLLGRERRVHDRVQADKRLELQELATALQFRATTDPLTSLSNRLRFNETLSIEMLRSQRYGTPLSLVLYDIDHFKRVNDRYGHLVGDSVLIELSRLVGARIRATDMLARWGGEEFAVLLPNTTADMAFVFAEQLRIAIATHPFDGVGTVTCSLGVAQYAGEVAEAFIARADRALYRGKLGGRNRVEVDPGAVDSDAESAA